MTRTLGTLATLTLLGALAGCGTSDSGGTADGSPDAGSGTDPGAGSSSGSSPAPDAGGAAAPCPDALAETTGAVPSEPAAQAPELPAAASAWVCRYQPAEVPDGPAWQLDGDAVEVDPADLTGLQELEPAPANRFCTEEIGPRWLVVLADDAGTRTGVVVDAFGCDEVRLTEDPAATAPGAADQERVEGGVLAGPTTLARDLAALHGA